ncbi:MAG: hypothetical protein IKA10_06785 [Oscillospiraceae bacterium]|nr:hypothetical protein [Oscillospiraceae bacterium]
MYPLHKEKYYLTGDTFHTFMRDRLEKDLKKEQNQYKRMAVVLFFLAVVVLVISLTNPSVKGDLVWAIIPILLAVIGLTNIKKLKQAEKGLDMKIIRDYTDHKYEKQQIEVKFYEDKLVMKQADTESEMQYITFKKYYEAEKYFAIYFTTGDIVIFNGNCKREKIKEIISSYIKGVKAGE